MTIQILVIYQNEQPEVYIVNAKAIKNAEISNCIVEARINKHKLSNAPYMVDEDNEVSIQKILSDAAVELPAMVTESITLYAD
jgi:hypothetical protein